MEWWLGAILLGLSLLIVLSTGLTVGVSLGLIGVIGMYLFWGGIDGLSVIATTSFRSVATFEMGAIPAFILMAEIIVFTGVAERAFDSVNKFFGLRRGGIAYSSTIACKQ